jgi:hypothetical protein
MKAVSFTFLSLLILLAFACRNSNAKQPQMTADLQNQIHQIDTANYTNIQWIDSVVNIGEIVKGNKVKIIFHFKNTGDKPLFIASARPSCGCTVADYTKDAILPGNQGTITAQFDSNHAWGGSVRKTITVNANAKNSVQTKLVFTGTIKDSTSATK